MKKFLLVLTLFLAVVCFGACGREGNTVRVASCGPLTGPVAVYGTTVKKGMELAIKEINESEKGIQINGEKYTYDLVGFIDDEHDNKKALTAFNTLYDKEIDAFLGAVTSGPTESVITKAISTGIPVLTPTATADGITVGANGDEAEERSNVFRACFNDSYQGYVMAKFAKGEGYQKIAVLYNKTDAYSTGLYDAFKAEADVQGLTVDKYEYQSDTSNYASYFVESQITDAKYDAVYLPDYYQTVSTIVETGRNAGYTKPFVGCDGWDGIQGIKTFDMSLMNGSFFSNHFAVDSTDAKVKTFVDAYRAAYNEDPTALAVLGYDAVYILKTAIEKANSYKSEDIIAALSSSDFVAECVTGNIKFDDNNNPIKKAVVMQYVDGDMKFYKEQD